MRVYVFSWGVYRMRVRLGSPVVCHRCGTELAVGMRVVSQKHSGHNGRHSKIYHEKCYEATFVDAP